jgi:hypothetical protein
MSDSEPVDYLLIDGVLSPRTLADLYRHDKPAKVYPLYAGTRWESLRDLGPLLVELQDQSTLIEDWFSDPAVRTYSTVLSSKESMAKVAGHLRHFISPSEEVGDDGLLRFSDPLVTHYWLSSLSSEQRNEVLGPIDHWQVRRPAHRWEVLPETPWTTFSRTEPASTWNIQHAKLGQAQLAALDEARRWKFEEDAYKWLVERDARAFADMNSQQISEWLKHTVDLGLDWGLVGENALIIWAETTLDLGDGFATQPGSRYLDWLLSDLEHRRLAPELRIKAFNQYRYSQKDFSHAQ